MSTNSNDLSSESEDEAAEILFSKIDKKIESLKKKFPLGTNLINYFLETKQKQWAKVYQKGRE